MSLDTNIEETAIGLDEANVRILKSASCPSLSGRSTLTYQIGTDATQEGLEEIYFRIQTNTGKGLFNNDWVSSSTIQKVFEAFPENATVTSVSLNEIFNGKSVNTAGFLLAALKAEGLVIAMQGKRRYYERASSEAFVNEMNRLIATPVILPSVGQLNKSKKLSKKSM